MLQKRLFFIALLALAVAPGRSFAQLSITIGHPHHDEHRFEPHRVGVVEPIRPVYPIVRPGLGVVVDPLPHYHRPPVISLRPTIYTSGYLRRFRPGYATILVRDTPYYYYPVLPPGAVSVVVGGAQYFQADGIWYQPFLSVDRTLYLIVPPPV